MQSLPLLKFPNGVAELDPKGVKWIEGLSAPICPVIFLGDGRAGKSYLASRMVNSETAFLSSDSAEPVTEGVDIVSLPVNKILEGMGSPADIPAAVASGGSLEQLLILDCEGGNNAMAAIRTLVNIFGIILGTEVVFVANSMASEQALQNLTASLAARSLVKIDGEKFPEQRLIFVVNKNMLTYKESDFEALLHKEFPGDPGRTETRAVILDAFPNRDFLTIPFIGMPNVDFDGALESLRRTVLKHRRPLTIAGAKVNGRQLGVLLQQIVSEIKKSNQVNMPNMNRYVIFDGFLMPLVDKVEQGTRSQFPVLTDYEPDLDRLDPREGALERYDGSVSHLHTKALVEEAREILEHRLDQIWAEVFQQNEHFGDQVKDIVNEQMEEIVRREEKPFGRGLLKSVPIHTLLMHIKVRAVVYRKRGGPPEYSQWSTQDTNIMKTEESAFEEIKKLPVYRGKLTKKSPATLRRILGLGVHQERHVVLKDGHLAWWAGEPTGEARGCLNFIFHRAEVVTDDLTSTSFYIRPRDPEGWAQTVSFSGDAKRDFLFDAKGSDFTRDEWMRTIRRHIEFANRVNAQIPEESIRREVQLIKPTVHDMEQ